MTGNDKPDIRNIDEGIWRRTKIVPWEVMIPPAERRPMPEILAEFDAERAGIFNWLLEGLKIYMEEGMKANIPAQIEKYTDEYRQDMDPVGEFMADCLIADIDGEVQARKMYEAYERWCHDNAKRAFTETTFARTMTAKKCQKKKGTGGRMFYVGFRLQPFADPDGVR
jgi:putative DNA primase/helicase